MTLFYSLFFFVGGDSLHQALYRKWRPSTFDEVCGQEHISSTLKYETATGKISHAYLFCGSRGTGKTSCAKILAKAINCLSPENGNPCGKCDACRMIESGTATDILEMDAASNNGVENIRDIRDEVIYTPSALKYRVYIVDEVHMLSQSAFNALLKTLEEPPAHVVFILATTELHKLPATIISRCQRFDFRRIATPTIAQRLLEISEAEGVELEKDAATLIAKISQGGMRDAISLLELCSGKREKITVEKVNEAVGSTGRDSIAKCVRAVAEKDHETIFSEIAGVVSSSKDLSVFWQDLINFYRDILIYKTASSADKYLDLTEAESEQLAELSSLFTREMIIYHSKLLDEALYTMQRQSSLKRACAELTLIRMCDEKLDNSYEALLLRVAALEDKLSYGMTSVPAPEKKQEAKKEEPKKEVKNEPLAPPVHEPKKEPEKRTLGALPYWREAVDAIVRGDRSVVGFFENSGAYKAPDGKIIIRFANAFACNIASREACRNSVRAIISSFEGKEINDQELIFEVASGSKTESSSIDELMENIN